MPTPSVPECVAPQCAAPPEAEFTVAAVGRLAGRDWQPGETILTCWPHADDIYRTQGKTDPAEVAEWLRPDAADPPNTWRPSDSWTVWR